MDVGIRFGILTPIHLYAVFSSVKNNAFYMRMCKMPKDGKMTSVASIIDAKYAHAVEKPVGVQLTFGANGLPYTFLFTCRYSERIVSTANCIRRKIFAILEHTPSFNFVFPVLTCSKMENTHPFRRSINGKRRDSIIMRMISQLHRI